MKKKRYFSVGTRSSRVESGIAKKLAISIVWLIERRKLDGTWGGPDNLDRLISTTHATMTLMAAGYQPHSLLIQPALEYLSNLNVNKATTFFWRSGPLLNVRGYEDIVSQDIVYLTRLKERAGGNPNYPAPFFLLKLLRFRDEHVDEVKIQELIDWILKEWSETKCWYGYTSITSMGLALLADVEGISSNLIDTSINFLFSSFRIQDSGRYGFSNNIIDDAFTVYNLYERHDVLKPLLGDELFGLLDICLEGIVDSGINGVWRSDAPFGGSVDSPDYATSVVIRAVIAREFASNNEFEVDLALAISEQKVTHQIRVNETAYKIKPFWGPLDIRCEQFCFVAMPFNERRTDIYINYVKTPIESETGLKCKRVDDMTRSKQIMDEVWDLLLSCSVVIADLSEKKS